MLPLILLLLLIPTALVYGQTNPWALFQRLCQGGAFATGPQCQNLGISSSSGVCGTNAILQNGVCVPTGSVNTTSQAGTCPSGFTLQGNLCIPLTSTTIPQTTTGACPVNTILQNGVCVP